MKCKICLGELKYIGSVPFDRNNQEIPIIDNTPMEYYQCRKCDAICCPEMLKWSTKKLSEKIYNQDYIKYDPDYLDVRPKNYANALIGLFGNKKPKHLDYGSGAGVMVEELKRYGWDSVGYDPYSNNKKPTDRFQFISAIEVVEHSSDIDKTIKDMKQYLHSDGFIGFSTLLAIPNIGIDWTYIGARNGHINIQSEKSINIIAKNNGLHFHSTSINFHILQRKKDNFRKMIYG